jgi:hypothetical protein
VVIANEMRSALDEFIRTARRNNMPIVASSSRGDDDNDCSQRQGGEDGAPCASGEDHATFAPYHDAAALECYDFTWDFKVGFIASSS